MKILKQNR